MKHWLIRGEVHQYIDHIVCFNTQDSHHPNKHMILHVFCARGYDSIVPLSWYKHWSVSVHRSAITWHLPLSDTWQWPPVQTPSMTCWKVGSRGLWTYHQLCILIQVLVRFTGSIIDVNTDLYRNPYFYYTLLQYLQPLSDPLQRLLTPLQIIMDLSIAPMDCYKILQKTSTLL